MPSINPSFLSDSPCVSVRIISGMAFQCLQVFFAASVAFSSDSFLVLAIPLDCISAAGGGNVEREAQPVAKSVIVDKISSAFIVIPCVVI